MTRGQFEGKVVLVTGGSRGIGLATARQFLSLGARVVIGARTASRLASAVEELDAGDLLASVEADVSSVEGCRATVAAAIESFGRLDVLVTNAGDYESAPIERMSEQLWDRTVDTHLKGTFFCVQAATPALRESEGCVVTMGSDAGLLGFRGGWAAYCAAKGGVVNLTRQLAIDLAPSVRVNAIAPGVVATDHLFEELASGSYGGVDPAADGVRATLDSIPLGRMARPEEVADGIVFLASAQSMTGAVLSLDAGTTVALP